MGEKNQEQQQPDGKAATEETKTLGVEEAGEPVEIELGADGEATIIEAGQQKKSDADGGEPEQKKSGRFQRKINTYRAQLTEERQTNQRLKDELDQLREKDRQQTERIRTTDIAAFKNHAAHVSAQLKSAQQELADAHESGDAQRISKATIEASTWAAEQASVDRWKQSHPEIENPPAKTEQQQQTQPRTEQPQQQQPDFSPEFRQWMSDNPWFVPSTRERNNPDFRPHLHQYAVHIGKQLEARYEAEGKDAGQDPAYWQAITDAVAKKFPEEFEDEDGDEEPAPPPRKGALPKMRQEEGAIPQRSASQHPGAPSGKSERITLDSDQADMARRYVDEGIYKHPDGKPLTYQEAYVKMARAIQKDRAQQQQKQRSA